MRLGTSLIYLSWNTWKRRMSVGRRPTLVSSSIRDGTTLLCHRISLLPHPTDPCLLQSTVRWWPHTVYHRREDVCLQNTSENRSNDIRPSDNTSVSKRIGVSRVWWIIRCCIVVGYFLQPPLPSTLITSDKERGRERHTHSLNRRRN